MQQTQSLTASIAIGLLLIYFIATNHVDLAPFNNLAAAASQLLSTLIAVIPFGMVLLGFRLEKGRWIYAGWIWSMVWLLLQIRQWWLPYLFGPTFLHENFAWYFQRGYAETIKLVPVIDGRPTPDLEHNILQVLSLGVVLTLWAKVRTQTRSR